MHRWPQPLDTPEPRDDSEGNVHLRRLAAPDAPAVAAESAASINVPVEGPYELDPYRD